MRSLRVFGQKAGRFGAVFALLFATAVPAVVPGLVNAAQVTTRSIQLSSSTKSATGVTYQVNFTAISGAGAFVVDFCSNTPLLGEACTTPTGFDLTADTLTTPTGGTTVADLDANTVRVTKTVSAGAESVEIAGITNPSAAGTVYARIVTFTNATHADGYTSANPDVVGTHIDDGGVAFSITDSIGVDAAVLESLTFCAASAAITANCGNASGNAPSLTLGEGTPKALTASLVSTGEIFTQLSTNAVSGAVVRIKSGNTNCSGLALNGGTTCAIAAAGTTGTFVAGVAKFGLYVNPTTGSNAGTGTIALTSGDATVTGTSTAWVDTPTVKAGDTIWTNGGRAYTVLSITSNTELELTANATANESTAAYTYGFGTYRVYNGGGTYSDTASTYRLDETNVKSTYGDPLLDTNDSVINGGNIKLTFGASISNVTPAGKYSNAYSLIATGKF